jgi:hypothetical protein
VRRSILRSLFRAARRQRDDERIALGAILADLGDRSFGWAMVVFALVNMIPLPIGANMITALPLMLLTAQMALGYSHVRLPGFVSRHRVSRRGFQRGILRVRPLLQRLERVIRPRRLGLFQPRSERLIGGFLFLVSCALFLPIPLSGYISAIALLVTAVGLAERDGTMTLVGLGLGVLAILVTLCAAITIALGVQAAT